jgi:hypothetical protein
MKTTQFLFCIAAAAVISGCAAPITRVAGGPVVVAERMSVQGDDGWNQLAPHLSHQAPAAATWTTDGLGLDTMNFYVAVKDGTKMGDLPQGKDARQILFQSAMQPHEVVSMFGNLYSRDGSSFTLDKLESAEFLGGKGFRFHYTVVRKVDEVKLAGLGWATVREGQLHAITFTAPQKGFFPRHAAKVEKIATTALLKG